MSTFLIISPEAWADHAVSKHHYALTLAARGHNVLFLDPPTDRADMVISRSSTSPLVRVVSGPRVAKGLRYLPRRLRVLLQTKWLEELEALSGFRVDVVWLFENSRFYDMGFAGARLKIYHQVDLNQDFHPLAAAQSADVCFCTTDIIQEELLKVGARVHKVHHGTSVVPTPPALSDAERNLLGHNGPSAAYIGNLAMGYLDVDLLLSTVQAYPEVRFHFIGGYSEDTPLRVRGRQFSNIEWWGKQPSALIPSLLAEVDVVMCTYQASRFRDQASPHKFMEYFASGKTIVATYTDEYKDKRELLYMVDSSESYVAAFGAVLADLPSFNSPERRRERQAFAAAHSYDAQLDRITEFVAAAAPQHAEHFRLVGTDNLE